MSELVMSIDQGTTGTTVLVIDRRLKILARENTEFSQLYPKPGWVEHRPDDIWKSVILTMKRALSRGRIKASRIGAIGITNQRETTVLWDKKTDKAAHNAIVWQCRRSAPVCERLKAAGLEPLFKKRTGLVLDPYFSGTKLTWLMENVDGIKEKAQAGHLAFGTVDSFLVYKLTAGAAHVTDVSNASRTLLMDLSSCKWDEELMRHLQVPASILPSIRSSSEVYGVTKGVPGLPDGIPVSGIAGDQQAALFGQGCFEEGTAKCTYGTGAFLLVNTGTTPTYSKHGLLSSVAWKLGSRAYYCLEGSVFIAGAVVQWMRDGLGFIKKSSEIEGLARRAKDSGGVILVPALTGLGAPHWRSQARGLVTGITRGTTRAHLARAALEGVALSVSDIIRSAEKDLKKPLSYLKVDGGASANTLLMQMQADFSGRSIIRPRFVETTALGAAFLAGLAAGVWKDQETIRNVWKKDRAFSPKLSEEGKKEWAARWRDALEKA